MLKFHQPFAALLLLASVLSAGADPHPHSIQKRGAIGFCHLIRNHTGRSCFDYNNYGCYCGWGNAGATHPADGVDNCCRIHDDCWSRTNCWRHGLIVSYDYTCTRHSCRCTYNSWSVDAVLRLLGVYHGDPRNSCEYTTCMCDLRFSQCLAGTRYNSGFKNFVVYR